MGDEVKHSADNKVHIIVNKGHTGVQHTGNTLDITVQGEYTGSKAPSATAVLHNMGDDGFTVPPLPNSKSDLYNYIMDSNMTSFFRFVNQRPIYRFGKISLAHAPVHVTDFSVVNVHVDELSSARIWQHKLCATYSAKVNINNRLPIKVYYRICTLRHIRIEIIHGSQNVF